MKSAQSRSALTEEKNLTGRHGKGYTNQQTNMSDDLPTYPKNKTGNEVMHVLCLAFRHPFIATYGKTLLLSLLIIIVHCRSTGLHVETTFPINLDPIKWINKGFIIVIVTIITSFALHGIVLALV